MYVLISIIPIVLVPPIGTQRPHATFVHKYIKLLRAESAPQIDKSWNRGVHPHAIDASDGALSVVVVGVRLKQSVHALDGLGPQLGEEARHVLLVLSFLSG